MTKLADMNAAQKAEFFAATGSAMTGQSDAQKIAAGVTAPDPVARGGVPLIASSALLSQASAAGMRQIEARRTFPLISPYSPALADEFVHPAPLVIPRGFGGFTTFLAITPYPRVNGTPDSRYENPCIYATNTPTDLTSYKAPPGVVNPVVPALTGTNYNADPHLQYDPVRNKILLAYRERGVAGKNRLLIMECGEDFKFSAPVAIRIGDVGTQDYAAPSFWYDLDLGKWVCVFNNLDNAAFTVQRITSATSDIYSAWSDPVDVTIPHPTGKLWWHGFIVRLPDGRLLGLYQDGGSGGGSLYSVESVDGGLTFTAFLFNPDLGFYRSAFIIVPQPAGPPKLMLFIGRSDTSVFTTMFAMGDFGRVAFTDQDTATRGSLFSAVVNKIAPKTVADNFTRADATTIGTPTSGGAYITSGDALGISGNRAYNTTTAGGRAMLDMGAGGANVVLRGRFDTVGTQAWLIFRGIDNTNYWRFGVQGGIFLQQIVAGSVARNISLGPAFLNGSSLVITASGARITIEADGVLIGSATDTYNAAATRVGVQAGGATPSYISELIATKQ